MDIRNRTTGSWLVLDSNNKKAGIFLRKYEALEFASKHNYTVRFHFYDHVWDSFDRSLLGKISLPALYAERAKQLRDKYDHLVLHYSGGSDSHNILHTFLTNNIKLDEIMVRWPKHWLDGKFYTANNKDTSAKNAPSEYDYAIKPTLEFIRNKHPEIKITIVDYTDGLHDYTDSESIEKKLMSANITRFALGSVTMRLSDTSNEQILTAGKRNTGHMIGVDKPALYLQNNNIYMYFGDLMFENCGMPEGVNVEPFYWTGEFPLLPMEQAYQVAMFIKQNKHHAALLNSPNKPVDQILRDFHVQFDLMKGILYKHSWDFTRFQAGKPNMDRSDWYSWIYEANELSSLRDSYDGAMKSLTRNISSQFLVNTTGTPLFAPQRTKLFHLMSLE